MFPCCHLAIWVGFVYVRTVATHKSQCLPSSNSNIVSNGNYAVKRWKRPHFRPPKSVCFQIFFPNNNSGKYLFWKVWIAGHQGGSRILCGNSDAIPILLPQASGTVPNFLHRKNWQWRWCNQILELLKGPNMPQHLLWQNEYTMFTPAQAKHGN